tara:strand:+ start:130 stop:354 length:225 start_codon:yes stop_codon:yes gene_type:complete
MKLDKIEVVGEHKFFQIREITDSGEYFRRMIVPSMDVSSEVQEIQDKAEELWTDEVKSAWTTYKAEQDAKREEE